ncbi:squalene--hopene cyclase [Minwuia thermotolerans]|uniref:Squalene--hopene cyclase n=1 Tax=Minwuia thermotolerans TaxID=2056226 RepID=A0A2M9G789_9PROT|nr:squalene--hopene cyclase [Minwuia thermotolerans]PJK31563.1 squalene--hopene cyclase [Minwuia thermotolerans]
MADTALKQAENGPRVDLDALEDLIADTRSEYLKLQRDDGHWIFEFEADATIPAEYVMLNHYLDEIDDPLEAKIGVYLRRIQSDEHDGWPLYQDGAMDLSCTVKAYYALKLIGDDPDAPHMRRARTAILAAGGAERANVFTRIALALFDQVPWRAVPAMPIEIMLLPEWFPFHLSKVSYWSRTVIAPLLIMMAKRKLAANPRGVDIRELFRTPPEDVRDYNVNPTGSPVGSFFLSLDKLVRRAEPLFPRNKREKALQEALAFIKPRLNGEDGLGGIFPAMANTVMAFEALGIPKDDPDRKIARAAVDKLILDRGFEAYCQPCLSPIWDTCLGMHALLEAGEAPDSGPMLQAADWLLEREITDVVGDWVWKRPDLKPGGWAFEYWNDHYPDVDDTAVVVMALHRMDAERYRGAIGRAAEWVIGMQSSNGGWGAFDAENDRQYLNAIPFADHGALLDPPTVDVTARCVSMLAQIGHDIGSPPVARGLKFLRREQEKDGSWYGRWGVNYIYGTWSALSAFNACGYDMSRHFVRRGVDYLLSMQRDDGGWGEGCESYEAGGRGFARGSTPSQTAWALLGLMAAGEVDHPAVARGIGYLMQAPRDGAKWDEDLYTGVGFPRVFYLRYYGYSAYFPLWAIARYRNLKRKNDRKVAFGI